MAVSNLLALLTRHSATNCTERVYPFVASTFYYRYFFFRDYYAALLRTHQSFVAPTQGKLLNYVQRVPLGVVAQITVRLLPWKGRP
jgi:hypothetical protein